MPAQFLLTLLMVLLKRNEVENCASNTAPVLHIFKIMAQMSFRDDDICDDDKDKNNEYCVKIFCIFPNTSNPFLERFVSSKKIFTFCVVKV